MWLKINGTVYNFVSLEHFHPCGTISSVTRNSTNQFKMVTKQNDCGGEKICVLLERNCVQF